MRKRWIKCILAAAMAFVGAAAAVFPVLADSPIKSSGNLVYEEGAVSLCAADFDYLYAEAGTLQQEQELTELPDISDAEVRRKDAIASKGVLNYADGAVVMDSSDFVRLADWMDGLDAAYENSTADAVKALSQIGTYFTTDGSVTHEPEKAAGADGNTIRLPYSKISEGISQSQSVAHLAEQGIGAAIAGNLSRGTAAWVDGNLIIGNGADNDAWYGKGYSEGETAGYQTGYSAGETAGYQSGYSAGEAAGYQTGYSAGEAAGYQRGYAMGVKDAETNVNPSSASYQAGYAQGKEDAKPVILTGTINDFEKGVSELSGKVQIPAGLSYVCAGMNVQDCEVYSYPEASVWNVGTSWRYDYNTGLVSFKLKLGGSRHSSSSPAINYTIMYIP